MTRLRWFAVILVALLAFGKFVAWPQFAKKILRDRCALDGGTLNEAGTICHLPPARKSGVQF